MAPHWLLRRENPPTASAARSPKIVIPCTLALLVIIALLAWAFRSWYRQDDDQTLPEIETAVRRRRSSTLASRLSAIDVEACRGALDRAVRSTGKIIRSPSPIREETGKFLPNPYLTSQLTALPAEEMEDVDLDSPGSGMSPLRKSATSRSGRRSGSVNASKDEDGADLVRVTTWGSIIAPVNWVKRFHSQKRREGKEKGDAQ